MSVEDYYIVKAYDFKDTRQKITGMLEFVIQSVSSIPSTYLVIIAGTVVNEWLGTVRYVRSLNGCLNRRNASSGKNCSR